jgi:LmbE family N-acetylglucosaminyl deacetylase
MKRLFALCLVSLLGAAPAAAMEPAMHAGELAHALDRLATTGRVLYVAAHPDDENTRLLAYLASHRHLTVAYLSMTRGGGGQNLIGGEQGDLLDVIRTEELLAARRLDGAVQRFTRMRDFGYSKTADETFAKWGREEALADVVWVVRTFQPDVIITRFGVEPPNHGHHTASAILAREAFAAAGDPARFPEQLARGARPWKAARLYHNFPTWRGQTPPDDALALDVGAYDVRLGLGYGELAARSRSQHKSQGFGVPGERGPLVERLVPLGGSRPAGGDPLAGLELGWGRYGDRSAPLARALDEARAALDRDRPERALPALARAHAALDALPDEPRVRDARAGLGRVIAAAAGLFVRATAARPLGTPGAGVDVNVELVLRSPASITLRRVELPGAAPVTAGGPLVPGEKKLVPLAAALPADARLSLPYYLEEPPGLGRYAVRDLALVGEPKGPPALAARVDVELHGRVVRLEAPVVHAWTDPVHGERVRDFLVAPPATVTPVREAFLFPGGRAAPVLLRVRAARDGVDAQVELGLPAGWRAAPAMAPVKLERAGDETTVRFQVTPAAGAGPVEVRPVLRADGKSWSVREAQIDHPHIPLQLVLSPAALRLVPLALKVPRGLVGYVRGSGDSVAADLAHVGVRVEEVDDEALRAGDLGRFTAIVLGVRAYNTRAAVRAAHPRLMSYVERGGTLVVQYNTQNFLGGVGGPIGPVPFELGRDRVTDEQAAVVPVDPRHPVLVGPNPIGPADFEGWVQERGIYFASKWPAAYQPVFKVADPGEEPLLGSLLTARHGKGRYVYTGLAFFRQLPAGVPGAYRLFANLLSR